jgi:three-Cys-motif partner protein
MTRVTAQKPSHRFGGRWTEQKLRVLEGYLRAYTTALKNTSLRKGYIDAFAGSGYRDTTGISVFPDLAEQEPQELLDGSARIALKTEPSFDGFVFIESHAGRRAQLERLRDEFHHVRSEASQIRGGDANQQLQDICQKSWAKRRAVLFLDPYGMQVEWKTIEAVASTRAIDMWLLFPLGIGVNRLLTRSGEIPPSSRNRLNLLLGTEQWYDEFYTRETTTNLFGDDVSRVVRASVDTIGGYFNERLRSIFAAVAETPLVLRNSKGSPLFLLCFAAGNPKGAPIAVRIAQSQLSNGWQS